MANDFSAYWAGGYQESANLATSQINTSTGKGDMSSRQYLHLAVAVIVIAAILLIIGRFSLANARLA